MNKLYILTSVLILSSLVTFAQIRRTVRGEISDTTGVVLPGASVKLISAHDTLSTASDPEGTFRFASVKASRFTILVSSIGFRPFSKEYVVSPRNTAVTLAPIHLKDAYNQLNEVVVTAVTPVVVKEDTTQYDARAYPVREGDDAGELLKRMPGMEVSKDGSVKAQGQAVTKIRLNGKDFFGNDATAALQNLPADIVKNVQLIDDYGEEAALTGVKSGDPQKILNINTLDDKKNGYYAGAQAGLGSTDRYNGRMRASRFRDDQRMTIDATNNNVSNRSRGSTETTSIGLNYQDQWGSKVENYGSYRFNRNNNNYNEQTASQSVFETYTRFDNEDTGNERRDYDHNLSWNVEYKIDEANYLKVKPGLSYSSSDASTTGVTYTQLLRAASERTRSSATGTSSVEGGAEIFFNHKFEKKGRNLSVNAVLNLSNGDNRNDQRNDYNNTDSLGYVSAEQQYQNRTNDNVNRNSRLRFSYMEPLGAASFLELNYQWSRTSTSTERNVMDIDPSSGAESFNPALSNHYEYQFITNRAGLHYRYAGKKLNYFAGIAVMPATLKGEDISRSQRTEKNSVNWIPSARLVYKFSKKQSLTARYNGRSNQPGFTQLQPVTDNADLRNIVRGNPGLKPEFTHNLNVDYNQADWGTGYIFNSGIDFSRTDDKIVTTKVIIPDSLKQITSYANTSGFHNGQVRYSLTKPFFGRAFTITYLGGSNFSNNVTLTNGDRTTAKNMVLNQGLRFRFDIPDVMNASLNTSYSANRTRYSSTSYSDRNTTRYSLGLEGRNYFFKDLTLGYDFSKEFNKGYSAGTSNPMLLNLFLEYRFLKRNRANVRLEGYDIFSQNTGISRDVFDNVIVDSRSNRLSRYFMLSFQYRIQKFGV